MISILMTWYGDGDEPQLETFGFEAELYEAIAVADSRRLRYRLFRLYVDENFGIDLLDEEGNPV